MITDVSIVVKPEDEQNANFIKFKIVQALADRGTKVAQQDVIPVFVKKSIDARHGQVKVCLRYHVYIGEKPPAQTDTTAVPQWKQAGNDRSVLIIGSGPAGLFGALRLLENGIKPVIIERGDEVTERKRDIASISTSGIVNSDSNYCFGEGGAGTFSDGKLYTRSNKRGDIDRILRIFNHFGASDAILTDAHPHIGTDQLPKIVSAFREKIVSLGGEFHFHTRCSGFITETNSDSTVRTVTGITCTDTITGNETNLYADAVLLATGHSAVDIYELLAKTAPAALESKAFAIGVRVEHPRTLIDAIQFHGTPMSHAAEYRLTTQEDGRGVYSFCMCPGGFVVPSATAPDEIVINGMSSSGRNSKWSNAAIVVETRPEDIPEEFRTQAQQAGCSALAGLLWRSSLEADTERHGSGQKAPAQRLTDFLAKVESVSLPPSSYTPGLIPSRLDTWLPPFISHRLAAGFEDFDRTMKGFICDDALMIAGETRTSTPVRILREEDTGECSALRNLYPAGEGSGYSGGIVSSAMDGENIAEKIINSLH
jgi:uncharacterized protein